MKFPKLKNDQFMYLCILSFVFIATSALSISAPKYVLPEIIIPPVRQARAFPDNPVLGTSASYPVISAQGVMVVDLKSGVLLYEKNPNLRLLPASTTKIITALVALDIYNLDDVVKISSGVRVDGQKIGLYEGEEMTVENLLNALLIYSANDAAEALARAHPLGREAYIDLMNVKAMELGMTNSHFYNPAGLDGEMQYATAKDLARATEVALRIPVFARMVSTKETVITDVSQKNIYKIKNINKLLGEIPGVMGVKTGWTENARENLVTYVERDGKKIIITLLGSSDRFGETKELIDWIFENYKWEEVRI